MSKNRAKLKDKLEASEFIIIQIFVTHGRSVWDISAKLPNIKVILLAFKVFLVSSKHSILLNLTIYFGQKLNVRT